MSVVVGPRVEFDPDHYPRIRVWDTDEKRDHYIYLHRCVAYAHGMIDSLWDERIVHHVNCDSWDNRPENLQALTVAEHEQIEPHTANLS